MVGVLFLEGLFDVFLFIIIILLLLLLLFMCFLFYLLFYVFLLFGVFICVFSWFFLFEFLVVVGWVLYFWSVCLVCFLFDGLIFWFCFLAFF